MKWWNLFTSASHILSKRGIFDSFFWGADMKNVIYFVVAAVIVAFSTGCYTQFAAVDRRPPPRNVHSEADSVARVDTVRVREREVCHWYRDFWGRPELRCYRTHYDADWYHYHNYPWWYDGYGVSRLDHGYGCHCPYHRYYHSNCSYCWESCDRYCHTCRDDHDDPIPARTPGGGAGPIRGSNGASAGTGTGSRGGQRSSEGGRIIVGPRPSSSAQSSSSANLPKTTVEKKDSAPATGNSSQSDSTGTRKPARQPSRRFGRTR